MAKMRVALRKWVAGIALSALAGVAHGQSVAPVANAGSDVSIVCVGPDGTPIALSGLGSSIGPDFGYLWSAPDVDFNDATSLTPIAVFPVGDTVATLTVTYTDPVTGVGTSASDTVLVSVDDPTAPMIFASADPSVLWPPNHTMHDVHVDLRVFDVCDASPEVELVSIYSNEPDNGTGDGNTTDDIQGAEVGTDDRDFALRAERAGPLDGRVYTAIYRVFDLGGNTNDVWVQVIVPHDMGQGGSGNGDDDGWNDSEKERKQVLKAARKAAKAQLKAAKKASKAAKKAYKAALKATR
jgi:hypothetical protein